MTPGRFSVNVFHYVESPKFNRGRGPGFRPKNNQGDNRNDQGAEALNGRISRLVW